MNIYPSTQDSERILGYLLHRLNEFEYLDKTISNLSDEELYDLFTEQIDGKSLLESVHEDLTEWVEEIQQYFIDESSNNVSN